MEQTTVKQFFSTRKSSVSSHPAKRRKVAGDACVLDKNMAIETVQKEILRKPKPRRTKSKKSENKVRGKRQELTISDIVNAATVTSETTSLDDQHGGTKKRKQPMNKRLLETPSRPRPSIKETDNVRPRPDASSTSSFLKMAPHPSLTDPNNEDQHRDNRTIKIDPWISNQAKLMLMTRGQSAVNAIATKKSVTTPKASDLLSKKSDDAIEKNDTKGVISVRDLAEVKTDDNAKVQVGQKRSRLYEKYAHLLHKADDGPAIDIRVQSANADTGSVVKVNSSMPEDKQPAYERFCSLATAKAAVSFHLPQKYKILLETFKSVDSVLYLLRQRSENCTFDKLKQSVQSMTGRKFDEKHLGQIKTVYPSGFTFRQEKGLRGVDGLPVSSQLTIDANFEDVIATLKQGKNQISPSVLVTRRNVFESKLADIIKKHHQKFLHKLNLKIDDSELRRWHPHFKLEEVPDVVESPLPKASIAKFCMSAKDMIEKARKNLPPQVEKALENVSNRTESINQATTKTNITQRQSNNEMKDNANCVSNSSSGKNNGINVNGANRNLKGVSQSLLERIRQKEQKKAAEIMTRDPEKERRLSMMDRLPDISRILKTFFTTERKAAITVEDCVQKLMESYGTATSSAKLEEHLHLLSRLVPNWLSIVTVRKCEYVKLAKNADINAVLNQLNTLKKQESGS